MRIKLTAQGRAWQDTIIGMKDICFSIFKDFILETTQMSTK